MFLTLEVKMTSSSLNCGLFIHTVGLEGRLNESKLSSSKSLIAVKTLLFTILQSHVIQSKFHESFSDSGEVRSLGDEWCGGKTNTSNTCNEWNKTERTGTDSSVCLPQLAGFKQEPQQPTSDHQELTLLWLLKPVIFAETSLKLFIVGSEGQEEVKLQLIFISSGCTDLRHLCAVLGFFRRHTPWLYTSTR